MADKSTKSKNTKPTSKAELEAISKLKEYKLTCESNIVSILWKSPDLYFEYDTLNINSFTNIGWKVYFQIGYGIIVKEKKKTLDEITIELYLEKHPKLKDIYDKFGGYNTISKAYEYVKINNIEGYVSELHKWNAVLSLVKNNFPIADRLSSYVNMSSEEIYDEFECLLNHVFSNIDGEDTTYKLSDGIYDLIDKLDEGMAVGLPLYNSPLLTHEIGGNLEGNITLMGGLSGSGKTTLSRILILPSIEENDEKIVIMINEEGLAKWQREMLIWVANNIFKEDVQKFKLRDGNFSKEFKAFLRDKCAKWIIDNEDRYILKPFKKYSTDKAIKYIKKYSKLGIKYFMLDTYKADADSGDNEAFWFNLQQNMVKIYDTIKEESCNVHIWVTFQLAKSSSKQRCYTQDNIGMAKNIIDVASTCIMIRKVFEDEFESGKNELKIYKLTGKNGNTKIPVKLDKKKHYQLLFIVKNREGGCNEYAIVVEHDMSRNTYKEIGITIVPTDF